MEVEKEVIKEVEKIVIATPEPVMASTEPTPGVAPSGSG